jgi:hypothetical protein
MIIDDFDERTVADMEVALQRACARFPDKLGDYEARKRVAARLLERARGGERKLQAFTDVAIGAATGLAFKNSNSR